MSRRKPVRPCRECKRREALYPVWAVCQACMEAALVSGMAPFLESVRLMYDVAVSGPVQAAKNAAKRAAAALESAAKGAGR